jgi:hypothetical protein
MGKKLNKNVPELRFPEFNNNWDTDRIDNFLVRHVDPVDVDLETKYKQIGIRSHGKGIFHEAYDRGGKFRMYQNNPVLKDYLLVSSTAMEIDLYHKNDAGQWMIINYGEGDTIELKSINLSVPIEQVYRGLSLEPENWQ